MFNVKIKTDTKIEWYDLMKNEEVQAAYKSIKEADDYIVSDIKSEWSDFDNTSSIDDMIETINLVNNLTIKEQMLFTNISKEGIHEPLDIAIKLMNSEIKYMSDIDEFDEIWETILIDDEELAILYG